MEAYDQTDYSAPSTASVTIVNAAPTAPRSYSSSPVEGQDDLLYSYVI